MNTPIEYKTVVSQHANDLDRDVNLLLIKGYLPYGSPYILPYTLDKIGHVSICQAMVRHAPDTSAPQHTGGTTITTSIQGSPGSTTPPSAGPR